MSETNMTDQQRKPSVRPPCMLSCAIQTLRHYGMVVAAITAAAAVISSLYLARRAPPLEWVVSLDDGACDILFDSHRPKGTIQHLLLARSEILNKALEQSLKTTALLTPDYPTPGAVFRVARMSHISGPIRITGTHESAAAVSRALELWMETYRSLATRYQANYLLDRIERDESDKLASNLLEKRALVSIIRGSIDDTAAPGQTAREERLRQLSGDVLELEAEWVLMQAERDALKALVRPEAARTNTQLATRISFAPSVDHALRERLANEQRDLFDDPAPLRVIDTRPAIVVVTSAVAFLVSFLAALWWQRHPSRNSPAS